MKNKIRTSYFMISVVLIIGLTITTLLQIFILKKEAKEKQYEFESQASNLTLFITDNLNKLVFQFDFLVEIAGDKNNFNNDTYLSEISQRNFKESLIPNIFTIFEKDNTTGVYSIRHISGTYVEQENWGEIESEVEYHLLSIIHGDLNKFQNSKTKSFFLDLNLVGKISCLINEVFSQENNQKILVSCFKLDELLDKVIMRSSYGWLEVFLYLTDNEDSYKPIYIYSHNENPFIVDPTLVKGDKYIFIPWFYSFADNDLSLLFSFEGNIRKRSNAIFIPSVLGGFLTLSICIYLISLKRRNVLINLQVEEKTKAYYLLNLDLEKEIEDKKYLYEKLYKSMEDLRVLTNSVNGVIWEIDPNSMIYTYMSDQVEKILGYKANDYISGKFSLEKESNNGIISLDTIMNNKFKGPEDLILEYETYRKDKKVIWIKNIISKIFKDGSIIKIRGVFFDITEEKNIHDKHILIEKKLKHSQKMEAIGQLSAGISHEINTPVQFVGDNLSYILDASKNFIAYHERLENIIQNNNLNGLVDQINSAKKQFDIKFFEEETPQAIMESIDGIDRIAKIVSAMKIFSHPGKENMQEVDINKYIESTVILARNEWRYLADLQFDFSNNLPLVNCFQGEISQVILNIIVNSCHAIRELTQGKEKGNILISTHKDNYEVIIKIKDNGIGIKKKIIDRIFDPFFTTKEVGQGTGQGLSLAYNIIVENHAGNIFVESVYGSGSTVTIQLPINGSVAK